MNEMNNNTITWQSPSNIALVKYWGKHGNQLPINPSVSITLRESYTTTKIQYHIDESSDELQINFRFEGKPAPAFGDRIKKFLVSQVDTYPILNKLSMDISSSNTFPHSSGIASSASAFSALALGIVSILRTKSNEKFKREFFNEVSELARLGSGSASRSVYRGYVVWGALKDYEEYSDNYAVPIRTDIHPAFQQIEDAILIVNAGTKKVGSSAGHELMNNHPFAKARIEQANMHMNELHDVLRAGDVGRFIEIVENEALSLHGLMLSSNPGYFLFEQNTINIIDEIRSFREKTGIPVCFTLDAGPNVHLLYPAGEKLNVVDWINSKLLKYCHEEKWIDDGMGNGPVQIN